MGTFGGYQKQVKLPHTFTGTLAYLADGKKSVISSSFIIWLHRARCVVMVSKFTQYSLLWLALAPCLWNLIGLSTMISLFKIYSYGNDKNVYHIIGSQTFCIQANTFKFLKQMDVSHLTGIREYIRSPSL